MDKLPRLLRFLLLVVATYLVAFSLLRLGFWLWFGNPADPVPLADLLTAFYLGLKFDLRLALLIVLPLLLLGWLRPLHPCGPPRPRLFWSVYLALATMGTLLFYMVDFGHFAYLQTRLDASALRFLKNLDISLHMVWESYPVVWLSLLLGLTTLGVTFTAWRLAAHCAATPAAAVAGWKRRTALTVLTATLVLGGLYGKFSWYPLRWSDAFFGAHAFAAQISFNPVLYFVDTVRNGGGVRYDTDRVREYYPLMATWLGVPQPDQEALDFRRPGRDSGRPAEPYNVVIVILESFASYKSGLSGNPFDPTPHIDALARAGYYFPNFYTPQTGTARSVFCAVTGIPDVETHGTSTRNPVIVDQHTIVNDFTGYEKFYFLGGSANWGNIRGLLANNIPGLHIYEEGSYSAPRVDVWGISDLDLFREANQVLKQQRQPFIAVIQTSGNHRPYTIPADNDGFVLQTPPDAELQRHGFESAAEYNSYRFMDHSVGRFIDMAKQEGYFHNTVFAFFGDHGITGHAGDHVAKAETQLDLGSNRVPFIIYNPQLIPQGRVFTQPASETDVLPTLAALTGQDYVNTALGRDLLDAGLDGERYAFKIVQTMPVHVGLIGEEFYFRMKENGSERQLHRLDSATPRDNLLEQFPDVAARMERMTRAYHETAKYLLYHNKPLADADPLAAGNGRKGP